MSLSNGLFRVKGSKTEHKVSFSELFFDLVFVYAITQTARLLINDFSPNGVAQGFLILLAVWWVWVFTVWVTNWLDPERIPVRLLLFALMLLGMLLAISIPQAFTEYGPLFAIAYVSMQLGRTLFACWQSHPYRPELHNHFFRMALWFLVSAGFWIYGSLQDGSDRMLYWALALAIEYLSASVGFYVPRLGHSSSKKWDISGLHMAERCGLLIIIALGESLLVTGNTFADSAWSSATLTGFLSAFVATVAMWWIYFSLSADRANRRLHNSHDTGHIGRLVYTYIHLLLIIGIVLVAVADELVINNADGTTSIAIQIAVIVGPACYLLGNILYKFQMFKSHPISHYIGLLLLALLVPVAPTMSPALLGLLTTVILVFVAIRETIVVLKRDAATDS